MAPPSRKRRAPVDEDEDDQSQEEAPRNTQTQRRGRRTLQADDSSDGEPEAATQNGTQNGGDGHTKEELIRKVVRYALACEYSRQNIRREGIRDKVIGAHGRGVSFKAIFEGAQKELRVKFGMQMMELPTREKVTLKERRDAAAKNASQASGASNSYALVSILPAAYRIPSIIPPSSVPTPWLESSYVGLYTTIISLISLAGGTLVEAKLERYLKRMNADMNMPLDSTPKVLAKMSKDGYIVKAKEVIGNEEITEWRVGPRGKVEVGTKGVRGLVEHVYGANAPTDLAKRIQSSLGLEPAKNERDEDNAEEAQTNGGEASASAPRRRGRRQRQEEEEEED